VPNADPAPPRMLTDKVSVVVTGGEGYLGSRVVDRLVQRGCVVTSLDDGSSSRDRGTDSVPSTGSDRVRADLRDRGAIERGIEQASPQFVFHLAALHFIPACVADPDATLGINVVGTQVLLDACARLRTPPTLVFASTADVYTPTAELLSESSPLGPNNVYGISKLAAEGLVRLAGERGVCAPVICRLFNLYGAGETNPHVIPEIVKQLHAGDELTLGNTTPRRDFVFVEDAADAVVAVSEAAEIGSVVNVGTGLSYSVDDVIATISQLTGRQLRVSTDPARWRPSDRENLQCDNTRLRSIVPGALSTTLAEGLRSLLVDEGLLT
jgi:UDP-glucose 4-epimerase